MDTRPREAQENPKNPAMQPGEVLGVPKTLFEKTKDAFTDTGQATKINNVEGFRRFSRDR